MTCLTARDLRSSQLSLPLAPSWAPDGVDVSADAMPTMVAIAPNTMPLMAREAQHIPDGDGMGSTSFNDIEP